MVRRPRLDGEVCFVEQTTIASIKRVTRGAVLLGDLTGPPSRFLITDAPAIPSSAPRQVAVVVTASFGRDIAPSPVHSVLTAEGALTSTEIGVAVRHSAAAAMRQDTRVSSGTVVAHGGTASIRAAAPQRRCLTLVRCRAIATVPRAEAVSKAESSLVKRHTPLRCATAPPNRATCTSVTLTIQAAVLPP